MERSLRATSGSAIGRWFYLFWQALCKEPMVAYRYSAWISKAFGPIEVLSESLRVKTSGLVDNQHLCSCTKKDVRLAHITPRLGLAGRLRSHY